MGGPAAITNLFAPSLSNATIKPIVFGGVGTAAGMTNVTGQIYGLEAGTGVTLTPNESNIVVSTTSGGLAFSDLVWTNDAGTIRPNAYPTNIMFRPDVPDVAAETNFYFNSQVYRANVASRIFRIYNGGSNALTVGPFGGIQIGRNNGTPASGQAIDIDYNTGIGEPGIAQIESAARNSSVGYFGRNRFFSRTNRANFIGTADEGPGGVVKSKRL